MHDAPGRLTYVCLEETRFSNSTTGLNVHQRGKMSTPFSSGFAHSPASLEFANRMIASNDQLDPSLSGIGAGVQQRNGELNWIRRSDDLHVARSRHGGLLRISADHGRGTPDADSPVLEYSQDETTFEFLGRDAEEALKKLADRFEASPILFRIVRDARQLIRDRAE